MRKVLQSPNGKRVASAGIGAALANFTTALLVDQFQLPIHPNVVATGTVVIVVAVNILVSKYTS